jgi:hypothetical protein
MDFNAIIKRAINVITKPNDEFQAIKGEQMTIADMYVKYAIFLAAIPAIAGLIGFCVIGVSFGFGTLRIPIGNGLIWAVLQYALSLVGVFLMAFIIDVLGPSFGAKKDMVDSMKAVVFSYTAAWIAGVLYIIPSISILAAILGLYTLYLLYVGMMHLKEAPADKRVGYFVVSLIVAMVVSMLIYWIVRAIAFGAGAGLLGGF